MADPSAPALHRALAYALCGVDLPGLPAGPADAAALADGLRAAGWDRAALRRHADLTRDSGQAWPHRVPAELLEGLSAAQFSAAQTALVADWGLRPLSRRVRSAGTDRPSSADERLLRDLPPHFGKL